MSSAAGHGCGYTVHQNRREDPTQTKSARRRFAQHLRARWDAIKSHIWQGLVENDALGKSGSDIPADVGSLAVQVDKDDDLLPQPGEWDFEGDSDTLEAFREWLEEATNREVLEKYQGEQWIRKAAQRGIIHSDARLREQGIDVPDQDVATVMRLPVHRDKLQLMFERSFEELEGITEATAQEIRREFADGLAAGANPEDIARNINERIDAVGKTRSTVLARTEVVRTHSEFTLDRFESIAGDVNVTIQAEFSTAGDDRVCPLCQAREGEVVTIEEARTETFEFTSGPNLPDSLGGEHPISPPIHPQCRCVWIPVVSEQAAAAAAAHPRAFTLLSTAGAFRGDIAYEDLASADDEEAMALLEANTGGQPAAA